MISQVPACAGARPHRAPAPPSDGPRVPIPLDNRFPGSGRGRCSHPRTCPAVCGAWSWGPCAGRVSVSMTLGRPGTVRPRGILAIMRFSIRASTSRTANVILMDTHPVRPALEHEWTPDRPRTPSHKIIEVVRGSQTVCVNGVRRRRPVDSRRGLPDRRDGAPRSRNRGSP